MALRRIIFDLFCSYRPAPIELAVPEAPKKGKTPSYLGGESEGTKKQLYR